MKLLVILCGILAVVSATHFKKVFKSTQTWTDVPQSQWQTGDIGNSLTWGIQQVLKGALSSGKISGTDYTISSIQNVQTQASGKVAANHKFTNVVLTNGKGSTFTTSFTVNFVSFSGFRTLTSSSYNVKTVFSQAPPSATSDWVKIDNSEVDNDADLGNSLDWALQKVFDNGFAAGKIPNDGNYQVLDFTIYKQTMTVGTNYKVQVEMHNGKRVSLIVNFVVYSGPSGRTLTSSSYKVTVG